MKYLPYVKLRTKALPPRVSPRLTLDAVMPSRPLGLKEAAKAMAGAIPGTF